MTQVGEVRVEDVRRSPRPLRLRLGDVRDGEDHRDQPEGADDRGDADREQHGARHLTGRVDRLFREAPGRVEAVQHPGAGEHRRRGRCCRSRRARRPAPGVVSNSTLRLWWSPLPKMTAAYSAIEITTSPMISVTVPMLLKKAVTLTLRTFRIIGPTAKQTAIQSSVVVLLASQPMRAQTIGATPKATAATVTSERGGEDPGDPPAVVAAHEALGPLVDAAGQRIVRGRLGEHQRDHELAEDDDRPLPDEAGGAADVQAVVEERVEAVGRRDEAEGDGERGEEAEGAAAGPACSRTWRAAPCRACAARPSRHGTCGVGAQVRCHG